MTATDARSERSMNSSLPVCKRTKLITAQSKDLRLCAGRVLQHAEHRRAGLVVAALRRGGK